MKLRRNVGLLVLATIVVLTLVGATWPLQSLVEVKKSAPAALPPGCDESLVPEPAPRLEVKQIPEPQIVPVSIPAPPSRSLRSELEAAHRALASNDRPAFDEHLRNARAVLSGYPAGGERNAAEDVLRVLDDAARVWDAQFQSPFFDERSDVYTRLSRYPGYADAVRRGMLTDDQERRFYPAAESRVFLTRVAADRLPRLGVRPQTRIARDTTRPPALRETVSSRSSSPRQTTRVTQQQQTARATPQTERATPRRRSYSPSRSASRSKSSKPAASAKSAPSSPDRSVAAAKVPAEPAPAASPAPVPSSTVASAPPAADVPAPPTVPTDTFIATETSGQPAETTGTAVSPSATTTSAAEVPAATADPERRSVVVPALLILIGLGVLVLLFRAAK